MKILEVFKKQDCTVRGLRVLGMRFIENEIYTLLDTDWKNYQQVYWPEGCSMD